MSVYVDRSDTHWWRDELKGERHLAIINTVRAIRQNQEYRKLQDCLFASLYAGRPVTGFGWNHKRTASIAPKSLTLNVIRNMIGAVVSKIASKTKPKLTFLTEDGNAELKEQAQKLEKFVGGVFYESKVYESTTDCFRDACIYGTGFLKVYDEDRRVCAERVPPHEMVVDDGEGSKPRNMYQRKYVDRELLAEMYPEQASLIRMCPRDAEDIEYGYETTADQVLVTEAWHEGEGKKPGVHAIVIANADLFEEPLKGGHPFSVMRWTKDIDGFFGVGLAEELRGIQTEINKLLMQIQRGHHLIAGHWLVLSGSTLKTQLNNDLATICTYTGTPPQYQAPAIIAPEIYQHLWQLYTKAFEISGISQLNATGQKPAGMDSGVAMRTYQDIQTERFLEVGEAFEEFVVEGGRLIVRCAKNVGGKYRVRSIGKGAIELINWSDIDIDDTEYAIRVYPTNLLPSTPAGKLQWAQDMIKAQVIPPDDVLEILDFPDTEAYTKRRLAPRRAIEKRLAKILKDGTPWMPDPFDNLALVIALGKDTLKEWECDGVDDSKLDLLRETIANAQDLKGEQDALNAPPPMPMGPPGMPPGGPMPPPPPGMGMPPPPMPGAPPMAA